MDPTVSIITPWKGHADLIPDYEAAVLGAEVITVDNSLEDDAALELLRMTERLGGVYIRNSIPAGFAFSSNLGLSEASGDILVCLNNDVRSQSDWLDSVPEEVQDRALYGPSLGYQNIYGYVLPYLEGWCVAGTRKTWESLSGWDAQAFRNFYWEDNDLSFRACQRGYQLFRTKWPLIHKGGLTIGAPTCFGEGYERNRAVFANRVRKYWECAIKQSTTVAQRRLKHILNGPSDIQHHLPLLFALARGNVLELGVRSGNSTCALIAGVEVHTGHVFSVDWDPKCEQTFSEDCHWTFICGDSRDSSLSKKLPKGINLLLLDTEHSYEQVLIELGIWSRLVKPGGTICVHDTESFPETRRAVEDFCNTHAWIPRFLTASNGLGMIEVPLVVGCKQVLDAEISLPSPKHSLIEVDRNQAEIRLLR